MKRALFWLVAIGLLSLAAFPGKSRANEFEQAATNCLKGSDLDLQIRGCSFLIRKKSILMKIDYDIRNITMLYASRAGAYIDKKRYRDALDDLGECLKLDGKDYICWSLRGFIHAGGAEPFLDYDKAIGDFTKAIEFGPKDKSRCERFLYRAEAYAKRAAEVSKPFSDVVMGKPAADGGALPSIDDLGRSFDELIDRAADDSNACLKIDPDNKTAKARLETVLAAKLAFGMARAMAGAQDLEQNVAICAQAERIEAVGADALPGVIDACGVVLASRDIDAERRVAALVMRARAATKARDFAAAVADYTQCLDLSKTEERSLECRRERAFNLASLGQYERALTDIDGVLERRPQEHRALSVRAAVHVGLGKRDAAIADFSTLIRLDPTNHLHFAGRGDAYAARGDAEAAIKDYSDALRLKPDMAPAHLARGVLYRKTGAGDAALADFEKTIALDARNARAYQERGEMRFERGEFEPAILDFSELIRLEPNYAGGYSARGAALFRAGKKKLALKDLGQSIDMHVKLDEPVENHQDWLNSYVYRSEIHLENRAYGKAAADMSKAIELAPAVAEYWNLRAWIRFKAGRAAAGLPDIRKALELDDGRASFWDTQAHIFEALGKKKDAIAAFREALARDPKLPESLAGLKRLGAEF